MWTLSFRKQNASCEKLKISWKWKTKKIKEILRTTNSVNSWEIKVHKKWIENKRTKIIIYKVIWPNNLLVTTYIYYISITEVKTTQTQVKDLPGITQFESEVFSKRLFIKVVKDSPKKLVRLLKKSSLRLHTWTNIVARYTQTNKFTNLI